MNASTVQIFWYGPRPTENNGVYTRNAIKSCWQCIVCRFYLLIMIQAPRLECSRRKPCAGAHQIIDTYQTSGKPCACVGSFSPGSDRPLSGLVLFLPAVESLRDQQPVHS